MNYELYQKLKDAGFKQDGDGKLYETTEGRLSRENMNALDSMGTYLTQVVYIPTLSELINACGKDFGRLSLNECDGQQIFDAYPNSQKLKERKEWFLARGTPEEAVANLWLALNKDNSLLK